MDMLSKNSGIDSVILSNEKSPTRRDNIEFQKFISSNPTR
jgi:hypothetical protein